MSPSSRVLGWPLAGPMLIVALTLLAGCAGRNDLLKTGSVAALYQRAHKAMISDDTKYAIKVYQALVARFPFTNEARQSQLDLIYVYYREGQKDTALDAADQFLREEPANPRDDYAWYMKGLINFERTPYAIERFMGVDMARKPPTDVLTSISAFDTVVTRYPHSEYAHDALRRMTYLRNRLAEYDINVARYYVRRGAYLAAAQRANDVLEQYEGAPAEQAALQIMLECYRRLGLTQLASNVQRVYQINFPPGSPDVRLPGNRWWQFWRF
ncbi:MAG: outer membrane protein assembly factor BamD [Steroidobacteraceae bacterium]